MHDKNGTELAVGDRVAIFGTITQLCTSTEEYCNVTVTTDYGRRPDGDKSAFSAINTAQLVLVERPEASAEDDGAEAA